VIHSQIDAYRSSSRTVHRLDTVSGVVDTIFTLVSVALVVAVCIAGVRAWIAPGWPQIPIFAGLYLLVRAVLRQLFDPKIAWGPRLG
jgi:hypothetical protein